MSDSRRKQNSIEYLRLLKSVWTLSLCEDVKRAGLFRTTSDGKGLGVGSGESSVTIIWPFRTNNGVPMSWNNDRQLSNPIECRRWMVSNAYLVFRRDRARFSAGRIGYPDWWWFSWISSDTRFLNTYVLSNSFTTAILCSRIAGIKLPLPRNLIIPSHSITRNSCFLLNT